MADHKVLRDAAFNKKQSCEVRITRGEAAQATVEIATTDGPPHAGKGYINNMGLSKITLEGTIHFRDWQEVASSTNLIQVSVLEEGTAIMFNIGVIQVALFESSTGAPAAAGSPGAVTWN
ncbi:hypothetical protein FRC03_011426, partial [Tulasnella sp. 419]